MHDGQLQVVVVLKCLCLCIGFFSLKPPLVTIVPDLSMPNLDILINNPITLYAFSANLQLVVLYGLQKHLNYTFFQLSHEVNTKLGVCKCYELGELALEGLMLVPGSSPHQCYGIYIDLVLFWCLLMIPSRGIIKGLQNLLVQMSETDKLSISL